MARKNVQEERKLQILKALDTCLQKKSFEKTSIKDIATVAGVNHGVLHYYFKSKEDILLNYITYVMDDYGTQAREMFITMNPEKWTKAQYIEEIFKFVNNRITLNKNLSRIFVEIWEISLYNKKVRAKLQATYFRWIDEIAAMISYYIDDKTYARDVTIAMIAFWEGMALFSSVFSRDSLNIEEVLKGFQDRILEIL
ncbi:MAG: TetR/AcrR family transcriptional regulator [Deltaproteobacteria bacterium]|nr:TetR/AcrR family transcriptional regulator [Deltaproteobacteria bacterium]